MARRAAWTRLLRLLIFVSILSYAHGVSAAPRVAVLYPDMPEPYRGIFSAIIDGIADEFSDPLTLIPLSNDQKTNNAMSQLVLKDVDVIIALGRRGLVTADGVAFEKPVVVGALLLTPQDLKPHMSGVTLAVAPEVYFSQLKKLAPQVKRVHVVYNPTISAWVIDFAKASARLAGVELLSYQSKNIKDSALLYRDILRVSKPMEDAIWLMPDASSVDDSVILPLILKEAWNRNLVVFSGNPSHAKRGALFSLYPDNVLMGKALARLALQRSNAQVEPDRDRLRPLRDVQAAINLRTADHLGLRLSSEQQREYTLKFPMP